MMGGGAPMLRLALLLATVASVSCANDRPVWASQGGQDDPAQLKRAGELERTGKYSGRSTSARIAAKDGPTAIASRHAARWPRPANTATRRAGKRFVAGPSGAGAERVRRRAAPPRQDH
jgi:hypothetical protein